MDYVQPNVTSKPWCSCTKLKGTFNYPWANNHHAYKIYFRIFLHSVYLFCTSNMVYAHSFTPPNPQQLTSLHLCQIVA